MKSRTSLRSGLSIACACVFAAAAAVAFAAPRSVRATYTASMNGITIGTMTEQFDSDGSTYRLLSETKPQGLAALIQRQPLRFTSNGQVARDGLRPVQFEGRRSAGEPPQVSADFDWANKQLVLKYKGKTETVPLPPGTQDRLSVMYQFMFLTPERLRQLEFSMTNGRKVSHYRYRGTDEVEIDTGMGKLKTLHLVKQRQTDDPVTEVWVSPQHHNLPVKMLIVERNGVRFEQLIQSVEVRD